MAEPIYIVLNGESITNQEPVGACQVVDTDCFGIIRTKAEIIKLNYRINCTLLFCAIILYLIGLSTSLMFVCNYFPKTNHSTSIMFVMSSTFFLILLSPIAIIPSYFFIYYLIIAFTTQY